MIGSVNYDNEYFHDKEAEQEMYDASMFYFFRWRRAYFVLLYFIFLKIGIFKTLIEQLNSNFYLGSNPVPLYIFSPHSFFLFSNRSSLRKDVTLTV
jgi:hypothetical protein